MSAGGDSGNAGEGPRLRAAGAKGSFPPGAGASPDPSWEEARDGNRLLVAGESFEDLVFADLGRLPRAGEEMRTGAFERTVGGGAVISAAWARAAGLSVRILSALPPRFSRTLKGEGVGYRDLRRAGTPHAVTACLSFGDDRSFVTYAAPNAPVESRIYSVLPTELALGPDARFGAVLFAFSPASPKHWSEFRERAEAAGLSVPPLFWDFGHDPDLAGRPGFEALLRTADGVFVNELEAGLYGGRKGALRRAAGAGTLVIEKLGPRGAEQIGRSETRVPAPIPLRGVRDTTGAGDAFNAGFLAKRLAGGSLAEQLAAGNALGARCVQRLGGLPPKPWAPPEIGPESGPDGKSEGPRAPRPAATGPAAGAAAGSGEAEDGAEDDR